jgi:predicted ArsR family transcriptional regulator
VSSWQAVAVLVDPVRRALFDHVRRAGRAVGREEAADATGVSRPLAAFHLDKLVEAGLLSARYEAPSDRPRGRGRTPKVYEAAADISVTVPPRRYELLASLLAEAVDAGTPDASAYARERARQRGVAFGQSAPQTELAETLRGLGFEPVLDPDGQIVLDNCPFHAIALAHPTLVCGLNLAFLGGLLQGLGIARDRAVLAPRAGHCCVEITPG